MDGKAGINVTQKRRKSQRRVGNLAINGKGTGQMAASGSGGLCDTVFNGSVRAGTNE